MEQTNTFLRNQWSNPSDIFTILLIIGGDVVRVALAQLCAGPVPGLTPVTFSFGWVTYAVSAMLSAVGENRLIPKPELDCVLINAKSGYVRPNYSWVLSRMLRDFEFWHPRRCIEIENTKLQELREANDNLPAGKRKHDEDVRVALRVTVWQCVRADGKASGDLIYWIGLLVAAIQLGIAAIPWRLHGEYLVFLITAAGTILAFASGALPQWAEEKFEARLIRGTSKQKDVILTTGNGAHDALLILGCHGGLDLETLASPFRERKSSWTTRIVSLILAILWILLLITCAGFQEQTWYLVGVGMLGMLHNVCVAGFPREPKANGIDLQYVDTFVEGKVMDVLWKVEESYPKAGAALIETFFPGKLFPREKLLWEYADRRYEAWKQTDFEAGKAWKMPSLRRAFDRKDDGDIPEKSEYVPPPSTDVGNGHQGPITNISAPQAIVRSHVIDIP